MGVYLFFGFCGALGALIVQFLIADEFRNIARSKGHDSNRYFWFCFLLGLPGYLMVIALPDRRPSAELTPPSPMVDKTAAKSGGTADAWVGTHSLKCERCYLWQPKNNTTCSRCGATFTNFIEQ